jgi:transposase
VEVLYARCAGLDVHKDTVVACIRIHDGGQGTYQTKTFGTTTKALLELGDWLNAHEVTHVAMEATGVYWKPVWHVLDGLFELVLANAQHIKNVPGRKTDIKDSQWIADLLAHGLIRASFVPPTAIQDMRTLMRTRKQLVRERAQHVQRIQKTLEDANVKLASVISDVTGVSGRAILDAIVNGQTNPDKLLAVTTGRLKATPQELKEALRGHIRSPHRFLLKLHLGQIDSLDKSIADMDREVGALLDPFRAKVKRLTTIPGVSDLVAEVIISEIGVDMSRFPTADNLISWAGLCRGNHVSANKRRSTRLKPGAPWLKTTMVQAAWAAARSKNGYLPAQFRRISRRRGPQKAIMAVTGSMLTAAYFIIRDDVDYRDLGAGHFDRDDRDKTATRLVKRLTALGFSVEIKEAA